jgi:hypothetical protein
MALTLYRIEAADPAVSRVVISVPAQSAVQLPNKAQAQIPIDFDASSPE